MGRRIWLVPYGRDWSYDFNAQALARELAGRFELRIAYRGTKISALREWRPDLAVDFWWNGHVRKLLPATPVIKQVSSHRWQQDRYGLTVAELVARCLRPCQGVLVPSMRLRDELTDAGMPSVHMVHKGFDPVLFGDEQRRGGDLAIGWAGNAKQTDKRVNLIQAAAPDLKVADRCYKHEQMPAFYNSLDVITCASDAEGDPLTLIEGMACGCFPVTVDVGIVPELVRHGENGLIVERTSEAFANAFAWCRENLERVREAGARNASEMRATRTWAAVAPAWGDAFAATIEHAPEPVPEPSPEPIARGRRSRIVRAMRAGRTL